MSGAAYSGVGRSRRAKIQVASRYAATTPSITHGSYPGRALIQRWPQQFTRSEASSSAITRPADKGSPSWASSLRYRDGTFTVLMNHELGAAAGIERAARHRSPGKPETLGSSEGGKALSQFFWRKKVSDASRAMP